MCGAVSAGRLAVPREGTVTCIGTSPAPAKEAGSVKVAIAMQKLSLERAAAEARLSEANGKLSTVIK